MLPPSERFLNTDTQVPAALTSVAVAVVLGVDLEINKAHFCSLQIDTVLKRQTHFNVICHMFL